MELHDDFCVANKIKTLSKGEFIRTMSQLSDRAVIDDAIKNDVIDWVRKGPYKFIALTEKTINAKLDSTEVFDLSANPLKFRRRSSRARPIGIDIVYRLVSKYECRRNPRIMYIFPDNTERTAKRIGKKENIDPESWYYKEFKNKTPKCLHTGRKAFKNPCRIRGEANAFPLCVFKNFEQPFIQNEDSILRRELEADLNRILKNMYKYDTIILVAKNSRFGYSDNIVKISKVIENTINEFMLELGIDNTIYPMQICHKKVVGTHRIYILSEFITFDKNSIYI